LGNLDFGSEGFVDVDPPEVVLNKASCDPFHNSHRDKYENHYKHASRVVRKVFSFVAKGFPTVRFFIVNFWNVDEVEDKILNILDIRDDVEGGNADDDGEDHADIGGEYNIE